MANLDDLKNKLTGAKPAESIAEKGEKPQKGKNGGRRAGSGRKPLKDDEKRLSVKQSWESFAEEEVEVRQIDKGTLKERKVKMRRLRRVQEAVYAAAVKGDIPAAKEFSDRVGGKPAQPIRGEGEDDAPIRIAGDIGLILKKAYGKGS